MPATYQPNTERQSADYAATLAFAQEAAEEMLCDTANRCPCCDNILNLDIWELPDGTGHLMEVCECGWVQFDPNRIVVRHEVQGLLG